MPATLTFEHYEVMTRDDGSLCELGRGAMGITYKGFDTRLRVPVALKVINAAHLHSETARQRFIREARSAARLRHRNVASVFHLGEGGENYFYAMEFIDGETVDARVKKHGPLAPALALKIGAQVARALNAAQTHELVHRDIKPANLMLVHEDDELIVKVIDFGLAKIALGGAGEDAATLTMSGFLGTPHFASPEQLEEREIDVRSDIYSLGVTLWFALTGKTPFSGSVMQVMSQHITRQPPFEQLENVPAPVVELLRGMLDKNPAQRPQTALELRREIERCLARIGDSADSTLDTPPVENGNASSVSESDETQFETGAAVGTRFVISEHVGETESGRVFRARDNAENRDVRLLALDRELMADSEAIAQIEADAAKLGAFAHPNVLGVYGVTNDGRSAYLTLEWIDGFSLRDVLRVRRELSLAEVLRLLPQAAAGIDAAESVHSERLHVTLPQLAVHFPECQIDPQNLLRRPVGEWPDFEVKFNALPISRDRFALTWDGGQTIVGGQRALAPVVHEFAAIVYEMLGGTPAAIGPQRYTPLASIDENENEILRRAILAPEAFTSAANFVQAFAAPPEAAPLPPVRTAAETTTPESPGTEIRIEPEPPAPEPVAPEPAPAEEPTAVIEPPPVLPVEVLPPEPALVEPIPEAPPPVVVEPIPAPAEAIAEPPQSAVVEPEPVNAEPVPPALAEPQPEATKRRPALPFALLAILLLLGAFIFKYPRHEPVKRLASASPIPLATPVETKPTPAPTPAPTPVPPPPPLTPMELANIARKKAETLEAAQETHQALRAWLDLATKYEEFKPGRNGLELLIERLRNRPGGLPRAEFEEMREDITKAAKLDVLAAMMLLGEQLEQSDPPTALEWFSAAAEKGDATAMTQTALLLSNNVGPANNPEKVVHYVTKAAEKEEPNGMMALGQLYLKGRFGITQDTARAIPLLKAAADKNNSRACIILGDYYHHAAGATHNDKEAFRLFTKAADDPLAKEIVRAEAIGNLGSLYMMGQGTTKNERLGAAKLKQASEMGDAESMFYYAGALTNGIGTAADPAEGRKWYRKAAEAGHAKAAEWCKLNKEKFTPR